MTTIADRVQKMLTAEVAAAGVKISDVKFSFVTQGIAVKGIPTALKIKMSIVVATRDRVNSWKAAAKSLGFKGNNTGYYLDIPTKLVKTPEKMKALLKSTKERLLAAAKEANANTGDNSTKATKPAAKKPTSKVTAQKNKLAAALKKLGITPKAAIKLLSSETASAGTTLLSVVKKDPEYNVNVKIVFKDGTKGALDKLPIKARKSLPAFLNKVADDLKDDDDVAESDVAYFTITAVVTNKNKFPSLVIADPVTAYEKEDGTTGLATLTGEGGPWYYWDGKVWKYSEHPFFDK